MSIESSPSPSPYKGPPGSICAAGVSRLSEEVISWASLSSSAVIALPGSVSFIAGSFMSPIPPNGHRHYSRPVRNEAAGGRSGRAGESPVDDDDFAGDEAIRLDERH